MSLVMALYTNKSSVTNTLVRYFVACSRISVSGGLKKVGGQRVGSGREKGELLFSPESRSPLLPLIAGSIFRPSSLTESLEQTRYVGS